MRTVKLYGRLRAKFGKLHRFEIKSPIEAIRALGANFKEFRAEFAKGHYAIVIQDDFALDMDQLAIEGTGAIKIIPVMQGANNGWTKVLAGAAVIAIAYGLSLTGWGAVFSPSLYGMGASLVLGGISQLLARPPSLSALGDRPENQPSLSFNGPVNTYAQGQPVPIGYGELMIGSNVISASVVASAAAGSDTPTIWCGGGLPAGRTLNTTAGSTAIESFTAGDEILAYNTIETGFSGATSDTVGYIAEKEGTIVTITFNDSAETLVIASDTDVYDATNLGRMAAGGLVAGDKIATATGSLTVDTVSAQSNADIWQITEGWFADNTTGVLFRCYRKDNANDTN